MLPSPQPSGGNAKPNQTLPKREILRRKKEIDEVFEHGKSLREPFLKILFRTAPREASEPVAVALFAASKRAVRKAVHRNRLKRLLREAYRLHKQPFLEKLQTWLSAQEKLCIVFLYQPYRKDELTLPAATTSIQKAFERIIETLSRRPKLATINNDKMNDDKMNNDKANDAMTKQRPESTSRDEHANS